MATTPPEAEPPCGHEGGSPPERTPVPPGGRGSRQLRIALTAVLTAVSLLYLLRPIGDPDFFWHLKTGEWIWEHRSLPASDPFSNAGTPITMVERFTLTSYWASQLLYHFTHSLGGMGGIALLRLLIVAALFTVTWKRRRGDPAVDTALLLVFAVSFLEKYYVERPQVLSFLLFGLLLLVLERLRGAGGSPAGRSGAARGCRGALLLALVMLVWSNVHGGFILGQVTIVAYLTLEGAKFAHRSLRPIGGDAYRALAIAGIAGLVVSFANPNLFSVWDTIFLQGQPQRHGVTITEYASTLEALRTYRDYTVIVQWTLMLLTLAAVVTDLKRIDLTDAVLAAASGYFAFRHTRYGPVFMIVALPIVGQALARDTWLRLARPSLTAGALALVLVFARNEARGVERLRTGEWVSRTTYPVDAADFLRASGLRGTMFNFYNWGGYLIWRLAPEMKVLVDGRNLNPEMQWQASVINIGYEGSGRRAWQALLDEYGVVCVLTPYGYAGEPFRIVDRLRRDPGWVAVWSNTYSIVFVRASALRAAGPQR